MRCICFCTAVLIFPSLLRPMQGFRCGPKEYSSISKCCKKCSPGEQMKQRCTAQDETRCETCDSGYYSRDFHEDSSCTPCTICDKDRGLREAKKCEKTSDTVCICLPGFSPEHHKAKQSCQRCPPGHFSKGGTDRCQPWTNCTARGWELLQAGRTEEDAICYDRPSGSPRLTAAAATVRSTLADEAATTPKALVSRTKEAPPGAQNWGFLLIFLLCATVVLVLGGSVFCLLKSKQRNKKHRVLETSCQGDRKNSYRIPIQEEQVGYKSSLVQI